MSAASIAASPGARLTSPGELQALLRRVRVIAMVGASPEPWRPSHGIMRYLQRSGFKVLPVNPTHAGESLHGEPITSSLSEARRSLRPGQGIDLVSVFRRPEALPDLVEDAIAAGAAAIWTQLGIRDETAAARARAAGLAVVMDRCISVEHSRAAR